MAQMGKFRMTSMVLLVATFTMLIGCKAFDSSYGSADADLVALPQADKDITTADKTKCETPKGLTIVSDPKMKLEANAGFTLAGENEKVNLIAAKKGEHSVRITLAKTAGDTKSELSFLLKLYKHSVGTGDTKIPPQFSACSFNYTVGSKETTVYKNVTGTVTIASFAPKGATAPNKGVFELSFKAPMATKAQAAVLGAADPVNAGNIDVSGVYVITGVVEEDVIGQ